MKKRTGTAAVFALAVLLLGGCGKGHELEVVGEVDQRSPEDIKKQLEELTAAEGVGYSTGTLTERSGESPANELQEP